MAYEDLVGTTLTQTLTNKTLTAPDINGGDIAGVTISGSLTWSAAQTFGYTTTISMDSEATATNALWISLKSTVTSGDLTGIRSRVYGNAASSGANVRGGYFEAKMAAASKFAAMLEGALFHADYSAGSATISGDVRGFTAHISQGSGLNAANLYGGLINIQTRGDETIATDDVGLLIRNEAVGGAGRQMDSAIKVAELNMGGGTKGFGIGVDFSGIEFPTAGISLGENAIALDTTLSTDGKYSGIVEPGTAGVALAFGDIVYLASTGKWLLAKADSATTSKDKLGMVVLAADADTDPTTVLLYGKIRATTLPALTVGAPVHISETTAGDVQVAAPTGTTNWVVRIIGYGATAEDLFFCPDNTYLELA